MTQQKSKLKTIRKNHQVDNNWIHDLFFNFYYAETILFQKHVSGIYEKKFHDFYQQKANDYVFENLYFDWLKPNHKNTWSTFERGKHLIKKDYGDLIHTCTVIQYWNVHITRETTLIVLISVYKKVVHVLNFMVYHWQWHPVTIS